MENPVKKEETSIPMYDGGGDLYFAEQLLRMSKIGVKYSSLLALTLQNAGLSILMRVVRTQKELFIASSAVLMAEVVKLITTVVVCCTIDSGSFRNFVLDFKKHVVQQPVETLKVSVPSLVYFIQNNLLYVGATHLDAATCQVTYQLKILTTALFSVFMLNKRLNSHQWVSLVILFLGVALVQIAQMTAEPPPNANHEQNPLLGFLAVVAACCLSGFAGVYFEKILKSSDVSVWMRNIQLCLTSVPIGLVSVYVMGWSDIAERGFFYGYNPIVWSVILLQALGGLVVALVVKFADNILKGFATSLAIVLSCVFSVYVFDFHLSLNFLIGASLVISSIFLYSKKPPAELHKK